MVTQVHEPKLISNEALVFFNLRSDFDVIIVFPIVRERSITFANLLRKRRNASYLLPRLSLRPPP